MSTPTQANPLHADRDEPPQQNHRLVPALAPKLARAIVVTVFGCICLIGFLHIAWLHLGVVDTGLSIVYMVGLLSLQLLIFSRAESIRSRLGYAALIAQVCLVYLPILQFHESWVGMPGFLAGAVLLVLPPAAAWTAFALIAVSMAFFQAGFTGAAVDIAYTTVSTVLTGLVVYGLSRLAGLITALHGAREELAQMAVAQERLRFARDLHDLLGYSLSTITLKSELTRRLVNKDPEMAEGELAEILDISRQALSDVRSVARGYRELSLDEECRSARSVLLAAEVDVHMELDYDELPVRVSTVLATVLREGVTNLLRHSKAQRCEITVRQVGGRVHIDIINDGVPETPADQHEGSGIQNLSVRVAALNGELSADLDADGSFGLHASVPVRAERNYTPTRRATSESPADL